MSDLSQLLHRKMTPVAFILKQIKLIQSVIGKPALDSAIDGAAGEIDAVKAKIEAIVDEYLKTKLPTGTEAIAESITDSVLNSIAAALKGALVDLKDQ